MGSDYQSSDNESLGKNYHLPGDRSSHFKCVIGNCHIRCATIQTWRKHIKRVHKKDPNKLQASDQPSTQECTEPVGPKPFMCVIEGCTSTGCSTSAALRRHIWTVHRVDPTGLVPCPKRLYKNKKSEIETLREVNCLSITGPRKRFKAEVYDGGKKDNKEVAKKSKLLLRQPSYSKYSSSADSDEANEFISDKSEQSDEMDYRNKVEEAAVCHLCCICFFSGVSSIKTGEDISTNRLKIFANEVVKEDPQFRLRHLSAVKRFVLCPKCRLVTTTAVDRKIANEELEKDVKKLQRRAQRSIKNLGSKLEEYDVEMKKLGSVVNDGDVFCLQAQLERYPEKTEHNKLVMLLRKGIISAANNLGTYRECVRSTICDDKVVIREADEEVESSDGKVDVEEINQEKKKEGDENGKGNTNDYNSDSDNFIPGSGESDWSSTDEDSDDSKSRKKNKKIKTKESSDESYSDSFNSRKTRMRSRNSKKKGYSDDEFDELIRRRMKKVKYV